MKKILLSSVVILAAVSLAACGSSKTSQSSTSSESTSISKAESSSSTSSSQSSSASSSSSSSSSSTSSSSMASSSSSAIVEGGNTSEIANSDFSSLVGTWKNAKGQTLTITKDALSFSDILGNLNSLLAGTVSGSKLDIPAWNDESGNPKMVQSFDTMRPAYEQNFTIKQGGSTDASAAKSGVTFTSQLPDAAIVISFTPKGSEAFTDGQFHEADQSDKSRDRIWSIGGQGLPDPATLAQFAYYKQ